MATAVTGVNWQAYIVDFLDARQHEFRDSFAAADAMEVQLRAEFGRVDPMLVALETQAEFNRRARAQDRRDRSEWIADFQAAGR